MHRLDRLFSLDETNGTRFLQLLDAFPGSRHAVWTQELNRMDGQWQHNRTCEPSLKSVFFSIYTRCVQFIDAVSSAPS